MEHGLRRSWDQGAGIPIAVPGTSRSGAGSHRRIGDALGGLADGSGLARGGGQSSPGARFCQSHRQVGQDRCPGCPGAGAFRPSGPSAGAPVAGRGYPGAPLPDHPPQPGNDHAGGREEPLGSGHSGSASAHPSPHRLVGAGTGGPGPRSEADSPPEPRVAGEGQPVAQRPRRWGATLRYAVGAPAGTGCTGPEADCRPGGSGSHQPGQREDAG